jgi:4'-phosphopantetheinyl transferase
MNWPSPPLPITLASDEIHIWKAPLDGPPSYAELLSADEQERANRFLFEKHRNRFVNARGILRTILGNYLGSSPKELRFRLQKGGKPELHNEETQARLRFNLAHTGDLAIYALALDHEIGIDLERVRPYAEALPIANRFFSKQEYDWLLGQPLELRNFCFFRLWTRKEAYLKASGDGLRLPLNQFTILPDQSSAGDLWVEELEPEKAHVAALMGYGCRKQLMTYSYPRYDP